MSNMNYFLEILTIFLCLLTLNLVKVKGVGVQRQGSSTLFKGEQNVIELHYDTLIETISNSEKAWAVMFYSTWCGSCQRFAPVWINFANDVSLWSNVTGVAAIACSDPENTNICADYLKYYPNVRFFPPYHSNEGSRRLGEDYRGPESVTSLRNNFLSFLDNTPNVPPTWPRLQPVTTVRDIHGSEEQHSVLFIDDDEQYSVNPFLSREVILDLSAYMDRLLVSHMTAEHGQNYAIREVPSLYTVNQDGSLHRLAGDLTRKNYRDLLLTQILGETIGNSNEGRLQGTTTTIAPIPSNSVHSQDLESSIYYSLFHQVPTIGTITGQDLQTIKTHLDIIIKLLPIERTQTKAWLKLFNDWLQKQNNAISNHRWMAKLTELQTEEHHIPERVVWSGCLGTQSRYRGYPCSLWTLFHTLTVMADSYPERGITGKDVLQNMRHYILTYFLCEECRNNFAKESAALNDEVSDDRSAVMWLWRTHNRVNERLHQDPTEDPGYLKKQFPGTLTCPQCYSSNLDAQVSAMFDYDSVQWSNGQVYSYLHGFYVDTNIMNDTHPYTFVKSEIPVEQSPGVHDTNPSNRQRVNYVMVAIVAMLMICREICL